MGRLRILLIEKFDRTVVVVVDDDDDGDDENDDDDDDAIVPDVFNSLDLIFPSGIGLLSNTGSEFGCWAILISLIASDDVSGGL